MERGESIVHTISNDGIIWSSARQVTGSLKWGNERNPRCVLQVSHETARVDREEGGDDAKSAWPFDTLGYTHDTMDETMGCQTARWS